MGFTGPRREGNPKDPNGEVGLQSPLVVDPEGADVGTINLKSCCPSRIGHADAC